MKGNGFTLIKQKADDILQKLQQTYILQMIKRFLQIYLSKPNPYVI